VLRKLTEHVLESVFPKPLFFLCVWGSKILTHKIFVLQRNDYWIVRHSAAYYQFAFDFVAYNGSAVRFIFQAA